MRLFKDLTTMKPSAAEAAPCGPLSPENQGLTADGNESSPGLRPEGCCIFTRLQLPDSQDDVVTDETDLWTELDLIFNHFSHILLPFN